MSISENCGGQPESDITKYLKEIQMCVRFVSCKVEKQWNSAVTNNPVQAKHKSFSVFSSSVLLLMKNSKDILPNDLYKKKWRGTSSVTVSVSKMST